MPKRFYQDHQREPDQVVWSDLPPLYWKAFGIALLLGFIIGVGWIAWKLFEVNVLK
jgi:predicted negative regulator of RcsB-dependent stress response